MIYKILKSKYLISNKEAEDWPAVLLTILSASRTFVCSKRKSDLARISYFKNFSRYTLEVSVIRLDDVLYVTGVNKNAQITLSAMLDRNAEGIL
jgi:hypothetical protein